MDLWEAAATVTDAHLAGSGKTPEFRIVHNAWAHAVNVEFSDGQVSCAPDAFGPYRRDGLTDLHQTNRVRSAQRQVAAAAVQRAVLRWQRVDDQGQEHGDDTTAVGRAAIGAPVADGDTITVSLDTGDARYPRQAATMLRILGDELRQSGAEARIEAG